VIFNTKYVDRKKSFKLCVLIADLLTVRGTALSLFMTKVFQIKILDIMKLTDRIFILCGDGFMDFIHRPKSRILQNIKKLKSQRFGS
jgi:hypothetical protein